MTTSALCGGDIWQGLRDVAHRAGGARDRDVEEVAPGGFVVVARGFVPGFPDDHDLGLVLGGVHPVFAEEGRLVGVLEGLAALERLDTLEHVGARLEAEIGDVEGHDREYTGHGGGVTGGETEALPRDVGRAVRWLTQSAAVRRSYRRTRNRVALVDCGRARGPAVRESALETSMYRRTFTGVVAQGKTASFLAAMRENREHQTGRGIRARTTIWGAMTGQTNEVLIASDFDTLEELEKFIELSSSDAAFANVRRAVREQMVFGLADVSIHRLSYHSEGLISSEEATAPRKFMRTLSGDVQPGHHREFVLSISQALEYQKQRGIDATTSVWSAVTGGTSAVRIEGEFDSLSELEEFDDLASQDTEFARLRKGTRQSMVFQTSQVQLLRNLL